MVYQYNVQWYSVNYCYLSLYWAYLVGTNLVVQPESCSHYLKYQSLGILNSGKVYLRLLSSCKVSQEYKSCSFVLLPAL